MGVQGKVHRNADIIKAVKGGRLCADVAREYGISRGRVWQLCKDAGVRSVYQLSDAEKASIRKQYLSGRPIAHTESERQRSTVTAFLEREGLHVPEPPTPRWSDEEDQAILTRYYIDGSRNVAYKLGRTRNEVIGRANRLKKLGLLKAKEIY